MAIYTKVELPYFWEDKENLNLKISYTPSFTASYCYSEPMEAVKVKKIYFYQAENNADYVIDFTTQIYGKNVKTSEWDVLCSKKYSNLPVGDWSNYATLDVSEELQNNEYSQFRMNTKDSKRSIKYEIKLVEYSEKTDILDEYEFHEVSPNSTDCIFYKKISVTRYNDWVTYDLPDNIIPVAARINGQLTYYDWDGKASAELEFDYEKSGKVTVLSKTYGVLAGTTVTFDETIDNLNELYNEAALKIGHRFNSRTNGNTCYVRVYKWLERKRNLSTLQVKDGYVNTKNGPKKIVAVIKSLETGPKVIFGKYDLEG